MEKLSIRQIKNILDANGTDYSDCIEKSDFIRKLRDVRNKAKSGSSRARPSPKSRPSYRSSGNAQPRGGAAREQKSSGAFSGTPNTAAPEEIIKRVLADKYDFYQVMGLSRDATEKEVKKAFKKIALKLHPDKCKLPQAEDAFKAVAEAHSVLSDAEKRRDFDAYGAQEGSSSGRTRGHPFRGFRGGAGMHDMDDILRQMFGGGARMGRPGGFQFHFGGPGGMHFFNQGMGQRRRRRSESDDEQGEARPGDLFSQLRPMLPIIFMILMITLGPVLLVLIQKFFFVLPLLYVLPPQFRRFIPMLMVMMLLMN